jgi:aspartyl-tRNA(Asn)/glutamyl-tRNA(Gln) amidotransferase subunit B
MAYSDYETVIGLEIHAQFLVNSKLFCRCSARFGGGDNENTCPVCTGMPGALPVLNEKVVEFAVKTGLALNCKVNQKSVFSRKNYFYPDLPKGYQISQFDEPICGNGHIEFIIDGEKRKIGITRAHIEEDAGKSTHHGEFTLVNLNRSSVPLLEIVSEPDMRNPQEAAEYARNVRAVLRYLGVCDGNLEEGSMRCDCNVSVRKKGEKKLGTRTELKNINSFRFIEKAIQYEIERQIDSIEAGQAIVQETRLYDSTKNKTFSMRSKEEAHDYRYFPEPDLIPLKIEEAYISKIKESLPELPIHRAARLESEYSLPAYDAQILTLEKEMADYYEKVVKKCGNAKVASNWIMSELLRELNNSKKEIIDCPIKAEDLGEMIAMIDKNIISGKIAKTVFAEMFTTGRNPQEIVASQGLTQITDTSAIEKIIDEVMAANPNQLNDYRSGKDKLFGFFVGQAMKASKGQASPEMLNELLKKKLKG